VTWIILLCVTFQRSPFGRIERTQIGHKVIFDKCPALAGLGRGNLPRTRLALNRDGMHFEKGGGLFKIKRFHHPNLSHAGIDAV
jgi:hypothetical protein